MPPPAAISHLFLDVGGVLLTNGWDHHLRRRVADRFGLDWDEMEERHHLTYDTYELGKMAIGEYLGRLIFHRRRDFSRQDVIDYILGAARPFPDMIDFVTRLKAGCRLKVAAVSNEGRELAEDRIRRFGLARFVDFFVVSSFVHFRKPDEDIYRVALDVAQAEPGSVAYVDDRELLVQVAAEIGLHAIWHRGLATTRRALAELGVALPAEP
jgi:putative hydrolase of the HAD superfamily